MSTDQYPEGSAWTGWVIFAGFVLIIVGCINAIQGLVAIFNSLLGIGLLTSLVLQSSGDCRSIHDRLVCIMPHARCPVDSPFNVLLGSIPSLRPSRVTGYDATRDATGRVRRRDRPFLASLEVFRLSGNRPTAAAPPRAGAAAR
jgi:hypothetical protein